MLLPAFRKFQCLFCFSLWCFTGVLQSVRIELLDVWRDEEEGKGRKERGGGEQRRKKKGEGGNIHCRVSSIVTP